MLLFGKVVVICPSKIQLGNTKPHGCSFLLTLTIFHLNHKQTSTWIIS